MFNRAEGRKLFLVWEWGPPLTPLQGMLERADRKGTQGDRRSLGRAAVFSTPALCSRYITSRLFTAAGGGLGITGVASWAYRLHTARVG